MRILVTNDDGVYAPGIKILAEELCKEHEVHIYAPQEEQSASGHSLTMRRPLWKKKVRLSENFETYAITGTPVDCIKLGLHILETENKPVDIVISGINRGPNLGLDLVYSGTVSGALEGAILGKPAIAVSSAIFNDGFYPSGAKFILKFLKNIDLSKFTKFSALNINVPPLPSEEIKGWMVTNQSIKRFKDRYEERLDPYNNKYYWIFGEMLEDDEDPSADYKAIEKGLISVTPISPFMNHSEKTENLYKYLKEVEKIK